MDQIDAVCITLDPTSKERAQRSIKNIQAMGFKNINFTPGVDGKKLTDPQIKSMLTPRAYSELKNKRYVHEALSGAGSIGCYLAHVKAWQSCTRPLAIFEDDFVATPNAREKAAIVLQEALNLNFDILRLQHRPNIDLGEELHDITPNISSVVRTEGATAYIITPIAAKFLLSTCFPIDMQVDAYLDAAATFHDLTHLTSKDNLFADPELRSDIEHNVIDHYPDTWSSNTFFRHRKCILIVVLLIIVFLLL